jgi:hypothetical protein
VLQDNKDNKGEHACLLLLLLLFLLLLGQKTGAGILLLIIPHPKYSTLNPGHKTGADIAGVARLIHAPPTGKVQVSLTQLTNNCAFLRAQCGMQRERELLLVVRELLLVVRLSTTTIYFFCYW